MDINRRQFVGLAGTAGVLMATNTSIGHAAGELNAGPQATSGQPQPPIGDDENTSDILIETLITWGATHVFGIVGDGINPITEALRQRQDRITFVTTRHEESAAFMASAFAKHTGGLGVCLATTGPGAVHLLNGLYDAAYDNAPVVAITGSTFRDLEGLRFMQGLDTVRLMDGVAIFKPRRRNLWVSGGLSVEVD
jgi:pyruvate dehydrogenase (quinone)/pyruvate decarboxylase